MCLLKKVDRQSKHLVISKRNVVLQDRQFIVPVGWLQGQRRLQSAHDVIGDFEGRLVIIHRYCTTKIGMRFDGDSSNDGFDIATMVKQRSQAGPRLLIHPVAFVENADAAPQHRRHQRRGVILDPSVFTQHRSDQQVLGPSVGRALVDVEFLLPRVGCRDGECRFANAWCADNSRSQCQIFLVNNDPACEQLPERLTLANPVPFGLVRFT